MKKNSFELHLITFLIAVFALNQLGIGRVGMALGAQSPLQLDLFRPSVAHAMEMIMPVPNNDGKTTHLQMMPTITEVIGFASSGDDIADAKRVILATGTPFYAPQGISFDDPIKALDGWKRFESTTLSPELEKRFSRITSVFPCNFCCGAPTDVTMNGRCGCAHAKAARGFFRYMLNSYGDTYTDDQLFGEAYRWQALWYPAGAVEDYLLATGKGSSLQHKTHGGAGTDGMHGIR